jgi:hypothetical protein
MNVQPLLDHLEIMEAEVRTLRKYSATAQAEVLEAACRQFREAVAEWLDKPLTITEADKECPWWTAGTLAKKVRSGQLPQAGVPGAPRVRRRDVFAVTGAHSADLTAWAQELVDG